MTNEEREEFAQAVVAMARARKLTTITVQYRDGFDDGPLQGQHTVSWAEGRHGAPGRINMSYSDYREIKELIP